MSGATPSSTSLKPFVLSTQLQAHTGDVRDVATHTTPEDTLLVLSASRDQTACVWTRLSGKRNFEPPEVLGGHGGYVNSCGWLSDGSGGLFALTGGQDKLVNAFEVKISQGGRVSASKSPDYTLLGHADNVAALDVGPGGSYIVSGSWDKTAKIWKGWKCVATLEGHLQAVWAVLAVDEDRVLTASADKMIRLWSISHPKEPIAHFGGHTDAVRGLCLLADGQSFASSSNDGTINVYSLSSPSTKAPHRPTATLSGHTSFVYSLSGFAGGQLVSSGEDRSVRIWSGSNLSQTLTIPAISAWAVATTTAGDIVCGSSDHNVRVFTRDDGRSADREEIEAFERLVSSQALNKTQVGDVRKDQVPGKDSLSQPGTKEGQTKMVSNGDIIEAYQWSSASHKWEKIGEVVGGVGSGQKKLHEGKEYDYVFDVDIADGVPPLKLPYNLSDNAYVAAQRFLERNELPLEYLEQVVSFIDKNTEGAQLGGEGSAYVDPSGAGRYVPGAAPTVPQAAVSTSSTTSAASSLRVLPQKVFQVFKQANFSALENKLRELNAQASIKVDASTLIAALQNSSLVQPLDLSCLSSAALGWSSVSRFPLLDLYRLSLLRPVEGNITDVIHTLLQASDWNQPWPSEAAAVKARETNMMLAARAVANAFDVPGNFDSLSAQITQIISSVQTSHFSHMNKNGRIAYATIAYNFSALSIVSQARMGPPLLEFINQVLTEEDSDSEVIYRAIVALGNLLLSKSAKDLPVGSVQLARDAATQWGQRFAAEERIQTLVSDLKNL